MNTIIRLLTSLLLVSVLACGGDDDGGSNDNPGDIDAGGDTPDGGDEVDCYDNPTTHNEIINGCTDAESADKAPDLPLLNDDGTVPDPLVCE